MTRRAQKSLLVLGVVLLSGAALIVFVLMLPVEGWRTGEPPASPLAYSPPPPVEGESRRVWIDTDAACGRDSRTDVDDCLTILLLAESDDVELTGISTVFGNAPLLITDATTRALQNELQASWISAPPVYRGSAVPLSAEEHNTKPLPAHTMLRRALDEAPLIILALGPLTNIAITLRDRPDLQARVSQVISVMGRRKGHLFHPVEGGTAHSFFGHGPIFRDFNFTQDAQAAAQLLDMGLPLTLVPYEAAREVMLGTKTLDVMERRGGVSAWVARHSRAWLHYWQNEVNRPGFYPFDLLAATYVLQPSLFYCADVSVAVDDDTGLAGWLGYRGLFVVTPEEPAIHPVASGLARYCAQTNDRLGPWLTANLGGRKRDQ